MTAKKERTDIEIHLLLEGIYQVYGYDFRDYAPVSLERRIRKCLQDEGLQTISALQDRVLHDPACMKRLLDIISIDVTAMFRDPGFYVAFRQKVVPLLHDYHFIRIWHAGCASGEEVYSMAIVLREEGLFDKTRIYATDLNQALLQKAKEGIYPLRSMQDYTKNYITAGGTQSFSRYYTTRYDHALFLPSLKKDIVWAQHNLATDASFNEFQVILCRNVMIYFNQKLTACVHNLLYDSLAVYGVLGLGSKESLRFSPHEADYKAVDEKEKIYQKVK